MLVLGASGCGGDAAKSDPDKYPIVERPPARMQDPITMPNGAIVTLPALPTTFVTESSPTCERTMATFHDGSTPIHRPIVIPPTPGIRATALTTHTTRIEWTFASLPADCRPVAITLTVRNGTDPSALPVSEQFKVTGPEGMAEVTYPPFLPAPDVAHASAYSGEGHRSRVTSVLINRPSNTPPDQPEPLPPVTAPAGRPSTCSTPPTEVDDPMNDVLTYSPGSPPATARPMTSELSQIDIVHAVVQIDGSKVCATFNFAHAPAAALDFQVRFWVRDTEEALTVGSLLFRRTAGRLEVGYFSPRGGVPDLHPVSGGGAALDDKTLVMTGEVPAQAWQGQIPPAERVGWGVTTGYFPEKYGPYYGDSLPRHEAVRQPMIRHRDGETVRP